MCFPALFRTTLQRPSVLHFTLPQVGKLLENNRSLSLEWPVEGCVVALLSDIRLYCSKFIDSIGAIGLCFGAYDAVSYRKWSAMKMKAKESAAPKPLGDLVDFTQFGKTFDGAFSRKEFENQRNGRKSCERRQKRKENEAKGKRNAPQPPPSRQVARASPPLRENRKKKSESESEKDIEQSLLNIIEGTLRRKERLNDPSNPGFKSSKLYDFAQEDLVKIYDLRSSYGFANKGKRDKENETDFEMSGMGHLYAVCKNPHFEADEESRVGNRAKTSSEAPQQTIRQSKKMKSTTVNVSDMRCNFSSKVNSKKYASLRLPDTSRPLVSRNSTRSSKCKNKETLYDKRSVNNTPACKRRGRRIDSYLDSSFRDSNVSFHMQGGPPPSESHVVLASPSTLSRSDRKWSGRSLYGVAKSAPRVSTIFEESEHSSFSMSREEGQKTPRENAPKPPKEKRNSNVKGWVYPL